MLLLLLACAADVPTEPPQAAAQPPAPAEAPAESAAAERPLPPCAAAVCIDPSRSVGPGLTRNQVDGPVFRSMSDVQACYTQARKDNPTLQGKLALDFEIDAQGSPQAVRVSASSLADPGLEACVQGVLKGAALPAPTQAPVVASYPLVFVPR